MSVQGRAYDAPNCGGRVPVDTTPGPAPVCRDLKNLPLIPAVKTDSWNLSLRHHSEVHVAQEMHLRHLQDLSCATTGMSTTRQELQLWETQFSARQDSTRRLHDQHNRDIGHQMYSNRISMFCQTIEDELCATTGVNLVQELDAEATSGSESTFRENPKP